MSDHFYRDQSKGALGGVCAGLAQYFGVHPAWLRTIFVLVALSDWPAVSAYILLWILLPDKSAPTGSREQTVRANVREIDSQVRSLAHELGALFGQGPATAAPNKRILWLGVLLLIAGLASLASHLQLLGSIRLDQLWPIALILGGLVSAHRALRQMWS